MSGLDVSERIRRLLIVVPEVVRAKSGVPVDVLAEKLGVTVDALPEQLDRLMLVGKPPWGPDDLLELYIEGDRVHAALHQSLNRPPRLTHDEALALAVGAQCVRAGDDSASGPAWSATLEAALGKLEAAMTDAERARYHQLASRIVLAPGTEIEGEVRGVLWRALEARQPVALVYYSAHRDSLGERIAWPYGILAHGGYWYLVAGPDGEDGYKLFRLDRIQEARPDGPPNSYEVPADLDLSRLSPGGFGRPAGEGPQARIRIRGPRARYVQERHPGAARAVAEDGSVEVAFEGLSDDWLSAFVLSLGGEAEVLSPRRLREKVAADARRSRAGYG
jgi:proteasome accessory factor C